MQPERVILFHSRGKDYAILSNFWEEPITLRGIRFACPEACFHYAKLMTIANSLRIAEQQARPGTGAAERAQELATKASELTRPGLAPLDAKRLGGKGKEGLRLTEHELEIWTNTCLGIQREICAARLSQPGGEAVADILRGTGSQTLVHYERMANEMSFWGGKVTDGRVVGQNHLGKIWMDFRARLMDPGTSDVRRHSAGLESGTQLLAPLPPAHLDVRYAYVRGVLERLTGDRLGVAQSYLQFFENAQTSESRDRASASMLELLISWGLDPRLQS
jgi:predicted NAD-dependent protein-ADP-ribosyltransferase YbiA (DUF1768 family)